MEEVHGYSARGLSHSSGPTNDLADPGHCLTGVRDSQICDCIERPITVLSLERNMHFLCQCLHLSSPTGSRLFFFFLLQVCEMLLAAGRSSSRCFVPFTCPNVRTVESSCPARACVRRRVGRVASWTRREAGQASSNVTSSLWAVR